MFDFLYSIIGNYATHFISAAIDIIICWLYMLILCGEKNRREWFSVRIPALLAVDHNLVGAVQGAAVVKAYLHAEDGQRCQR